MRYVGGNIDGIVVPSACEALGSILCARKIKALCPTTKIPADSSHAGESQVQGRAGQPAKRL